MKLLNFQKYVQNMNMLHIYVRNSWLQLALRDKSKLYYDLHISQYAYSTNLF